MPRPALTPQEAAEWLRKVADHVDAWSAWPVQPASFEDSYRSQFVAIVSALSERLLMDFPSGALMLSDWEVVDKRMREILVAAYGDQTWPGGGTATPDA